jgi:hypothetical protein
MHSCLAASLGNFIGTVQLNTDARRNCKLHSIASNYIYLRYLLAILHKYMKGQGTVACPYTCTNCQCSSPCNCIMSLTISETITSNAPPITAPRVNFPPGTIGGTGASNSSEYLSDQDIAAGKIPKSTRTENSTSKVSVHSTKVRSALH